MKYCCKVDKNYSKVKIYNKVFFVSGTGVVVAIVFVVTIFIGVAIAAGLYVR